MTRLFGRTLREAPGDVPVRRASPWHRGTDGKGTTQALLTRAGMIRQVAPGSYAFLPLGWRVIQRIVAIVREELQALGAQELCIPDALPDPQRVFILLAQREIQSYRQLPRLLYQIQTRPREPVCPPVPGTGATDRQLDRREGLLPVLADGPGRTHQSLTLETCSFHADEADLEAKLHQAQEAYVNIFRRCEVDTTVADSGAGLPDDQGQAFVVPHPEGDDQVVLCEGCGYAATLVAAVADNDAPARSPVASGTSDSEPRAGASKGPGGGGEEPLPLEEVATPDCPTIAAVADYLGVPTSQTAKAVFYSVEGELVFVVIRGDLEVNEGRLARLLRARVLRPATEEEIRAVGAEPGYASPVGLPSSLRVIVDDSIPAARNLVAGANRPGYHLRNVNYGRDFPVGGPPGLRTAHHIADIAQARQGDACRRCGKPLRLATAITVGQVVKLGTLPAAELRATFLDQEGRPQVLLVGWYTMALDRLLLAIVATHHDEHGIIWPPHVAPFDLHIVRLGKDEAVVQAAESLYASLREQGFAVLYDDREESPGVKFADADLIGVPWRATVSGRSLAAGGIELKARWEESRRVVRPGQLPGVLTGQSHTDC